VPNFSILLSLTLFMALVDTNDSDDTAPSNNFAVSTDFFYGRSDFHLTAPHLIIPIIFIYSGK